MAYMYILPQSYSPTVKKDADGNSYFDISNVDYRVVDIGDIPVYSGEIDDDLYAIDFEGAESYPSDHLTEDNRAVFLPIVQGQRPDYITDVVVFYINMAYWIVSKEYPDIDGGSLSMGGSAPWLLVEYKGTKCYMFWVPSKEAWQLWPFANMISEEQIVMLTADFYPLVALPLDPTFLMMGYQTRSRIAWQRSNK